MTKEEEAIKKLEYYLQNSAYKRVDSDFFENNWELVSLEIPQAIETVLSMLKENSRENIQLKKQIDLMAETIRKLAISLANYKGSYNKETINFTGNIKDIKKYFERKVKNEL